MAPEGTELAMYNFDQKGYPDVTSIDADAWITNILKEGATDTWITKALYTEVEEDEIVIEVEYYIDKLNSDGKKIAGGGSGGLSGGSIWVVKKKEGGAWEVIYASDPPRAKIEGEYRRKKGVIWRMLNEKGWVQL